MSQVDNGDDADDERPSSTPVVVPRYSFDEALSGAGPNPGPSDNYKIPEPEGNRLGKWAR